MSLTPLEPGSERSAPRDVPVGRQGPVVAFAPLDLQVGAPDCLICGADLSTSQLFEQLRVCPACRFHYYLSARDRIHSLVDPDSFSETHKWVQSIDPLEFSPRVSYRVRLFRDQERTGLTEAAIVGTGAIGGVNCALVAVDFGFLGGSMGLVVGEKVARLFEHAASRRLPVVAMISSGGARIQEGVLSLNQMAKTVAAARGLRRQRLPLISVLANPTSGQILSSFASLSDIKVGEPGALIGFAPRGAMQFGSEIDAEADPVCDSEMMLEHGQLDRVVDREDHRAEIPEMLQLLSGSQYKLGQRFLLADRAFEPTRSEGWRSVQLARNPGRPTARQVIGHVFRSFTELHGDRVDSDSDSVVIGIGKLGALPVAAIGQERSPRDFAAEASGLEDGVDEDDAPGAAEDAPADGSSDFEAGAVPVDSAAGDGEDDSHDDDGGTPLVSFTEAFGDASIESAGVPVAGFRKAQRMAQLAEKFRIPLVVFVDAPGPAIGIDQELSGIAEAISELIDAMLGLRTLVVSVFLGECGGESALAFGISDRVLMLEHAVYTPIAPETGAATELSDRLRAPEVARSLRLTSLDAAHLGLVDRVVREPDGGAHEDAVAASRYIRRALMSEIGPLTKVSRRTLVRRRESKYRRIGEYGPEFRAAVRRELKSWGASVGARLRSVLGSRDDEDVAGDDGDGDANVSEAAQE